MPHSDPTTLSQPSGIISSMLQVPAAFVATGHPALRGRPPARPTHFPEQRNSCRHTSRPNWYSMAGHLRLTETMPLLLSRPSLPLNVTPFLDRILCTLVASQTGQTHRIVLKAEIVRVALQPLRRNGGR